VAVSSEIPASKVSAKRANGSRGDGRGIPLGLRFSVLSRDKFKCVRCGDHPAKNSDCDLHIDHMTPRSKGGRTEVGNLRTLCAKCNVGRGNRYDAEDQPSSSLP
jgi:5-methylcytosine-specific restriction endonuclease McrA